MARPKNPNPTKKASIRKYAGIFEGVPVFAGVTTDAKEDLYYRVIKIPLFAPIEGVLTPILGSHIVYREDNKKPLGVVGDVQFTVQNLEAKGILTDIVEGEPGHFWGEGVCFEGAVYFANYTFETRISIKDGLDEIKENITLVNSHDGSKKLLISYTPMNKNGVILTASTKTKMPTCFEIRHTPTVMERVSQAATVMQQVRTYFADLEKTANDMATIQLTPDAVNSILEEMFPISAKAERTSAAENARETVNGLMESTYSNALRNTGWAMFTALCTYADQYKSFSVHDDKDPREARVLSVLLGNSAAFKNKAMEAVLATTK